MTSIHHGEPVQQDILTSVGVLIPEMVNKRLENVEATVMQAASVTVQQLAANTNTYVAHAMDQCRAMMDAQAASFQLLSVQVAELVAQSVNTQIVTKSLSGALAAVQKQIWG